MQCNVLQLSWTEHGQRKSPIAAGYKERQETAPAKDRLHHESHIRFYCRGVCVCMPLRKQSLLNTFSSTHHPKVQAQPPSNAFNSGKTLHTQHMFGFRTMEKNKKRKYKGLAERNVEEETSVM